MDREQIMATNRLTIYLLRDVVEFDDALEPTKPFQTLALNPASGLEGAFYYSSPPATPPAWAFYVQPVLESALTTVTTSSASGLLVLKSGERHFALTFGYGRSFLEPSKIEHQFGLRVALNRIDASQMRSLDTKTFEDMVVTRTTQTSKSTDLPTFGIDVSRDILRAVTGRPRDESFAKRLSGSDALVINTDTPPTELPGLLAELYKAFQEDSYKADFEWIDHLALVDDGATITVLNSLLEEQLIAGDTSNSHMAAPEAINWEDIDAFKIAGAGRHEFDDLDLDDYLDQLGSEKAHITVELLKSRRVSVRFSRSSTFDSRWNLFQCLITEQRIAGKLHVLIEGRWFAVSDSLVAEVDAFATNLPPASTVLIASTRGEVEAEYNERLANTVPDGLLLLDAHIKRPGGAASGIELCDVLSASGEFIHVKRKSRSSTLSHLFAQGTVSATTFVSDGYFRDEVRKMISEETADPQKSSWLDLVPSADSVVDRSKYSVSFVVIANSSRAGMDWLPFFSKLNLMQNGKQLMNLGFSVSVSRVDAS